VFKDQTVSGFPGLTAVECGPNMILV